MLFGLIIQWYGVLGQFLLASKKDAEYDQTAFNKALEIDPCHVTSRLELSKAIARWQKLY